MPGSEVEQEIREAVERRLRELLPGARIVHELNTAGTGSSRIDLAAVEPTMITSVEIKSKRDTLTRLQHQWEDFTACSHRVIVVAHEKHFIETDGAHRIDRKVPELALNHELMKSHVFRNCLWKYPDDNARIYRRYRTKAYDSSWIFSELERGRPIEPHATKMLQMLWRAELYQECATNRISVGPRATIAQMIEAMVWQLTGRDICYAVCRQLRAREFVNADPPIIETQAKTKAPDLFAIDA